MHGPQLGQVAAGAQPGKGEVRVLTRGDDQMQLRGQVIDQKRESVVHRLRIDHVIIVQDEDETIRDGGHFVEQGRQHHLGGRGLRGMEDSRQFRSDTRCDPLQRRDEIREKACRVVVSFIKR